MSINCQAGFAHGYKICADDWERLNEEDRDALCEDGYVLELNNLSPSDVILCDVINNTVDPANAEVFDNMPLVVGRRERAAKEFVDAKCKEYFPEVYAKGAKWYHYLWVG